MVVETPPKILQYTPPKIRVIWGFTFLLQSGILYKAGHSHPPRT
jgi:hypothetical protein